MAEYIVITGTDADENLGSGYPWISDTWTVDDNGTLRTPTSEDLSGNNIIYGLGGNDTISGGYGTDYIYGGDGDDTIYVFPGDHAFGEADNDTFILLNSIGPGTLIDGGSGLDTLRPWGTRDITGAIIRDVERLAVTQWTVSMTAEQLGVFETIIPQGSITTGYVRLTGGGEANFAIDPTLPELHITGSAETETITLASGTTSRLVYIGGTGDSTVTAGAGADLLRGDAGNDTLHGAAGNDALYGEEGDDILIGGAGDDLLDGGPGVDAASYADAPGGVTLDLRITSAQDTISAGYDTLANIENLIGSAFDDVLIGNDGPNTLWGGAGNDLLDGGAGRDVLYGGDGNDTLLGGAGNDVLVGGTGVDVLTGGAGKDVFLYETLFDSGVGAGNRDRILDFQRPLDVIDLSAIDADPSRAGDQDFVFIGTGAFNGTAGQLRYGHVGNSTIVAADVSGDGLADFEIELVGRIALTEANFIL